MPLISREIILVSVYNDEIIRNIYTMIIFWIFILSFILE